MIEWINIHLVFPAIPVTIGILFRYIALRKLSLQCLGVVELSFTMALISVLMIVLTAKGLKRRRDWDLARKISTGYTICAIIFSGLFVLGIQDEARITEGVSMVVKCISSGSPVPSDTVFYLQRDISQLNMVRVVTAVLSGVVVIGTVYSAYWHKLSD